MTAHRPVPDTGAEQARTGRTAVQGGPAAVSVHQPVDRPTQQHVHRPAAAGQAGGRYPRVGDARGTRPTAGTVRHRNRVTVTSCPPGSAAGGYRMGRWARLAMTVVVTAAIVVATLTVLLRPAAVPTQFVTVQPGDTLASIAVRALPDLDPADAIGVVESMNGLDGATVQVGAVLRVPAGDGNR
jgi:hypothetical protein